ncbi:AbrB/MazE/SpoVT family DNA-binding domain-containing protein [Candidatus Gottesmanbacteria bacterium]|nr:AbrB/MazE/SpoVT family DNA-binding domain-containing protein [Candidatus Gottesmanbacteria bacterium]MBI5452622.1 AbrB/MazE/SpoVT family DNA-binding domain-containing protein [Candidatus Gottesmanbacteria bacterium]
MQIVTISSKNQITLPVNLLRNFGLSPTQKLLVDIEDGHIILRPLKKTIIGETAGSLTPYVAAAKLGRTWVEIIRETKKTVSKRLAHTV